MSQAEAKQSLYTLAQQNALSGNPSTQPTDQGKNKGSIIEGRVNFSVYTDSILESTKSQVEQDTFSGLSEDNVNMVVDLKEKQRTFSSYKELDFEMPGPTATQFQ